MAKHALAKLIKAKSKLAGDAAPAPGAKKQRPNAAQNSAVKKQKVDEFTGDDDLDSAQPSLTGEQSAYEALVNSISSSGSGFASHLRRRQQQQEGDSESEDEDEKFKALFPGQDGEGEEGEDDEMMEFEEGEEPEGEKQGGEKITVKKGVKIDGKKVESEDVDEGENDDENNEDEHDEEVKVDVAMKGTAGDDDVVSMSDPWVKHISKQLTDADVASLVSEKVKYSDMNQHPEYKSVWKGGHWQVSQHAFLPTPSKSLKACAVKERLRVRWCDVHANDPTATVSEQETSGTSKPNATKPGANGEFVSEQQASLFAMLNSYSDVFYTARPYPSSNMSQPDPIMDAYLLHALNHIAKTADRVKKNNEKMGKDPDAPTPRDQGFTRPKVLILLPQRNFALKLIRRLVALCLRESRNDTVQGKEKLIDQFTDPDNESDEEEEVDGKDAAAAARRTARKNPEHSALFKGNLDDHFRVGIKMTRGAIKLFADVFQSDIIIASPIAIATKLAEDLKSKDSHSDFLTSIELLVVERADFLTMQNWGHVEAIVDHLNKLPKEQHGTDIMRVREWYLSGQAKHFRQTVLLSSFVTAEMNGLFNRSCVNHAGKIRLKCEYKGVLGAIVPQVRQTFECFPAASLTDLSDARFKFFTTIIWPRIQESSSSGGLFIFVPQYFDYVRLRNFMKEQDTSFAAVCEYSKGGDVTRSRARFFHQQRRIMLYTERMHFYNRHRIRGIKDVIFYSLPCHSHFYSELVNLLEESAGTASVHATVTVLYSKFDTLELERVVGSSRCKKMISSETKTFMFC